MCVTSKTGCQGGAGKIQVTSSKQMQAEGAEARKNALTAGSQGRKVAQGEPSRLAFPCGTLRLCAAAVNAFIRASCIQPPIAFLTAGATTVPYNSIDFIVI
jgi:hypothetical protein